MVKGTLSRKVQAAVTWLLHNRWGERSFNLVVRLLYLDQVRRPMIRLTRYLTGMFVRSGRRHGNSKRIDRERFLFAGAVLDTVDRIADERAIAPEFMARAGLLWTRALVGAGPDEDRNRFLLDRGVEAPWVLVIAPTGACNLNCPGCSAGSSNTSRSMPFDRLDRIVAEARRLWGIKVLVFTGGEPLLYRSESKGVLDIAEKYDDLLCLIFTNGTLVDRALARRLATLGTPTAAISVEGLRKSTDARRGKGAFERILRSMDVLRQEGALTGISMTATRDNCEELFSDELLDFFFIERSVFYGFVFQYMPEGRDPDPSLMPTPEQRLWMWQRSWEIVEKRRIPLFDFWNHGTLIGGCAAAGRPRGYLYIDWDGNVMPCVFAPYSACNINDIYAAGGTLNDAWASSFLAEIRAWQARHAACDGTVNCGSAGGRMVCACPVRDHYADFREMVIRAGARPLDESAGACLANAGFARQMIDYGRDFAALGSELFDREYEGPAR